MIPQKKFEAASKLLENDPIICLLKRKTLTEISIAI